MDHKGRITVFLCLMIGSMVLLGTTALKIVDLYAAKAKAAMDARIAVSSIKAEYNSYIFEHYHILLFDKNVSGQGEAALEEKMQRVMEENLGGNFTVDEVVITNFRLLMDDDCAALKEQINDYMKYATVEYGVEQIIEKTGGKDGSLSEDVKQDMEAAEHGSVAGVVTEEEEKDEQGEDPREFAQKAGGVGMLALLMPEDMELATEKIDLGIMPSTSQIGFALEINDINRKFDDYDRLKEDMESGGEWMESLVDAGCGITYAGMVFNCATNQNINENTVLSCEREYLICGKDSDYENLDGTVRRIVAIRMPVNFAYLVADTGKMKEIEALSVPISIATFVPEPVVRYLLAGAWGYVESLADVKMLLKGNRMPFVKSSENWITDLDNLSESLERGREAEESGLSYEDYLTILLSLNTNKMYYRMLDLMQLNAGIENENFQMVHAAVELKVDFKVSFGEQQFYIREIGAY